MTDMAVSLEQYQRNQLLAEIGITRWVNQDSPVIDVPHEWQTTADVSFDTVQPIITEPQADLELQADFKPPVYNDNDIVAPLVMLEPMASLADQPSSFINPAFTASSTNNFHVAITPVDERNIPIVSRFSIDIGMMNDCLLLVNQQVLQQDTRQAHLWQQIQMALKLTTQSFNFPLLQQTNEQFNHRATMRGHLSATVAKASFLGGVYGLTQGRVTKLAYLTPLPDLFHQPISAQFIPQTIPSLAEMLVNPQKKREFWAILSQSVE
ncbi:MULTISPECIES: hypothetical protein [unclassified Moraxella]|uniref:hypothetical protein n=1 Tax=unclassified Moraxella TaxID=2685852 RepID=UPI003AF5E44E